MTDDEYAVKIYCRIFNVKNDRGDAWAQGILDTISNLGADEQAALKSRFRYGHTYEQTGALLGGIKGEAARRIVNKAILKLKHPSRTRHMKLIINDS